MLNGKLGLFQVLSVCRTLFWISPFFLGFAPFIPVLKFPWVKIDAYFKTQPDIFRILAKGMKYSH